MTLSLAKLQSSKKTRKRRGRGNAAGLGTYSGRGLKGQKSRSGGKFKGGHGGKKFPTFVLTSPKNRGFQSIKPKLAVVNLGDLQKKFSEGEKVTPKALYAKGLIKSPRFGVKILGTGVLTKKLTVSAQKFSATAKDAILKAGGSVSDITLESKNKNIHV